MAGILLDLGVMTADELKERTRRFALDIIELCLKLGNDDLGRLVRPQLLRAGTGVATNYRAACRSRSRREFGSKLGIVVEEADESELWLDVLATRQYGPPDLVARLRGEAMELRAIFATSRATVVSRTGTARQPV